MALVKPSIMVEQKPLQLPPPIVFSAKTHVTTLENSNYYPLPPTPPPPESAFGNRTSYQREESASDWGWENEQEQEHKPRHRTSDAQDNDALFNNFRKMPRYDFVYGERSSFEEEINEFFNFQDKHQTMEGKTLFEETFSGEWRNANSRTKRKYIESLFEQLELRDPEARYIAARKLLYIAQGVFGEVSSKVQHFQNMHEYNTLLFELGALEYVFAALKVASVTLDVLLRANNPQQFSEDDKQYAMDLANSEISAHLCLLCLLAEVNMGITQFSQDVGETNPPVAVFLFGLVSQLGEGNRQHYPVKKLLLLLWKILTATIGDMKRVSEMKNASRRLEGLDAVPKNVFLKSTPQEYQDFHQLASSKYPAYFTPAFQAFSHGNMEIKDPMVTIVRRTPANTPVSQPFTDSERLMPTAIEEAVELYKKHLHISLYSYQMAKERNRVEREEAARQNMDVSEQKLNEPEEELGIGSERNRDMMDTRKHSKKTKNKISKEDMDSLSRFDSLYRTLLPQMSAHIGMLIRLIYYVNIGAAAPQGNKSETDNGLGSRGKGVNGNGTEPEIAFADMTAEQKQDLLDRLDLVRHKEVVTKACAATLLLLLKAAKVHHALKFEYTTQLLMDNNCAILILKMLSAWLQLPNGNSPLRKSPGSGDIPELIPMKMTHNGMGAAWLTASDEPPDMNFFDFCRQGMAENHEEQLKQSKEKDPDVIPSSFRNFHTAITLMRILQKITKRKTHRILAMVQWKASAVLKRAMKVNHVGFQLYALKLLKSQTPYLGKKWRSSNMKVITSIYLNLRPDLKDEYLAGEIDVDVDEALNQEQKLRQLINKYHESRYGTDFGYNQQDMSEEDTSHIDELELILSVSRRASFAAGDPSLLGSLSSGFERKRRGKMDLLELDPNFLENYEEWLHREVYEPEPTSTGMDTSWDASSSEYFSSSPHDDLPSPGWGSPQRSLFSATERFSKEVFGDEYDDTEWLTGFDEDHPVFFPGSVWDEPADSWENSSEDSSNQWMKYHDDNPEDDNDIYVDSGIGSWKDEGEANDNASIAGDNGS